MSTSAVSADTIDYLAKQAAQSYLDSGGKASLNEAIVKQARDHGLNPHHVQRVAERANLTVHGTLYKGASAAGRDRNIDFPIARPEEIQAELDGRNKVASSFLPEGADYAFAPDRSWTGRTPSAMAKSASGVEKQAARVPEKLIVAGLAGLTAGAATAGGVYLGVGPDGRKRIKGELHDPRLYSNLRGMATLESREQRKAAHGELTRGTRDSVFGAMREGFTRSKHEKTASATSVGVKASKWAKKGLKSKTDVEGDEEKGESFLKTKKAEDEIEARGLDRGLNKAAALSKVAHRLAVSADQRRDVFFGTLVKQASEYLRESVPFAHVHAALAQYEAPETPQVIAKLAKVLYETGKLQREDLQKCAAMLADPAFVSQQIPSGQLVNGNLSIIKTLDTLVNAAREGDQMRQRCKQLWPDRSVTARAVEL